MTASLADEHSLYHFFKDVIEIKNVKSQTLRWENQWHERWKMPKSPGLLCGVRQDCQTPTFAKKSFRYSHTLSVGFTNGQAGGWNSKITLSGNSDESKLWAGALLTWMMCNCSGYCIDKSCKYAPKQTLSKCENSQKKLFPVALDTAPYSQKHSYFHRCFPTGFTPESVSLRRRIVCRPRASVQY